jgi:tetratricopeptide (TPR) repeat protein
MKKTALTLLALAFTAGLALAQSVDDGIKFLYYQKNKSAKEALQKVVNDKPKDAYAIYWLGQAFLDDDDVPAAKALYQKALTDGVNDPWIWIGMGHVETMEQADINVVKQKFEQAITATTATKGKNKGNPDPAILTAIGRACADGSSKHGDPQYGIEKLKKAVELDVKSPEPYIYMGICYLKLGGDRGGEAVEAFREATVRVPNYAAAFYRIGYIYQSQNNLEAMNEWYGKAIAADITYAPVYFAYFDYYKDKDVNAAKEFLDKYVQYADKDCKTEFFVADYLFRAGKYQESLAKGKTMEAGDCKNFPLIHILFAYNYDRLGDSLTAKAEVEKFLATAPADKITPDHYVLAAKIAAKFPGSEDQALGYLDKAIDNDTSRVNKVGYANAGALILGNAKKYERQVRWFTKALTLKGEAPTEAEYYKISKAAADAVSSAIDTAAVADLFPTADSITNAYISAYPDKPQGYSYRVLIAKKADRDSTKGLALPAIEQYNAFLMKDSITNKKVIYLNDYYLLIYYAQYQKSLSKAEGYKKAIEVAGKMQTLYPDATSEENKFATQTKNQLQGALDKFEKGSKPAAGKSNGSGK